MFSDAEKNGKILRYCSRCDITRSPSWHLYWTETKNYLLECVTLVFVLPRSAEQF